MSHTLHAPRAITQRRTQRTKRLLALEAVAESLLSVAGLTGAPVVHRSGAEVGQLVDIVVRWEGEPYPPLTGLVVRVGRRLAWVPDLKYGSSTARAFNSSGPPPRPIPWSIVPAFPSAASRT